MQLRTIVVAMSLLALGVGAASASAALTTYYFVGEDLDGNIVVQQLGSEDHFAACGGTAPLVTACSTGTHTMTTGTSILHGIVVACATAPIPTSCGLTHSISQISDGVRTRTFGCDVATPYQVPFLGLACAGTGSFPITTFTHNCQATGWRGLAPAAVGDWGCQVINHSP